MFFDLVLQREQSNTFPFCCCLFVCFCFLFFAFVCCGVFPQRKIIEILLVPTREPRPYPLRVQELCESRGGRPGVSIPVSPYGLCARKATLK